MAKSYKLKGGNYIDSTGIVHDHNLLSDRLNTLNNKQFQAIDSNSNTFEIIIPHRGSSNIKSALVITTEWCGIVSIGSSSQTWVYMLGNRNETHCTAEQIENTNTYVKVKLTFTGIQYGGLSAICPWYN